MIEKLHESGGSVLGFCVSGKIGKDDYPVLVPEVEALVEREGSIGLLPDLEGLDGEAAGAWGADLRSGREFHRNIDRLAIVGTSAGSTLWPTSRTPSSPGTPGSSVSRSGWTPGSGLLGRS